MSCLRTAVVVCTFNPKQQHFERSLAALARLAKQYFCAFDCLIVDNNSQPHVAELPYVQDFLRVFPSARVVREEEPGLSAARLRGISETTADILVFFDDDNEPAENYLHEVNAFFNRHPEVGVVGPGNVDVEFLGPVPGWIDKSCRHFFQERHSKFTEYACIRTPWHAVYPAGTGQSVRRVVLERYAALVVDGVCTATGRKGKSLASGEDGQIVHTAVLMGYAAGICPEMRLRHLIPESRCSAEYLARLSYGVTASLLPAAVESFPELRGNSQFAPPSRSRYLRDKWVAAVREWMHESAPLRRIRSAARVGDAVGRYGAAGLPVPPWLTREKHRLKLP